VREKFDDTKEPIRNVYRRRTHNAMTKRKRTRTTQKTEDGATLTPQKNKQTKKQKKKNNNKKRVETHVKKVASIFNDIILLRCKKSSYILHQQYQISTNFQFNIGS